MHLLAKFNLVLITVFACALAAVCVISDGVLKDNARAQVLQNANIMMATAMGTRTYTTEQIKPLLHNQMEHKFLPQTVPAYAATESFNALRTKYPDFTYKEATLNPTNLRDRAADWEADIVNKFNTDPKVSQIVGTRSTPSGESLYLSAPIRITNAACLTCHSTPDVAPASMIKDYGTANGFGWKMNDVVGAQIVSVPTALPNKMAHRAFNALLSSIVTVFIITLVVLNIMLTLIVIRPVTQLSHIADEISKGNIDVAELPATGKDEIAGLAASFNRMQRSLKTAMSMLDDA